MKFYISENLNGLTIATELESEDCRLDHKRNTREPGRIYCHGTTYTPTRLFRDREGVRLENMKALPSKIAEHCISYDQMIWRMFREIE